MARGETLNINNTGGRGKEVEKKPAEDSTFFARVMLAGRCLYVKKLTGAKHEKCGVQGYF